MSTTRADATQPLAARLPPGVRLALFPIGVLLVVLMLGLLEVSGSSLALYETSLGVPEEDAGVIVGPPRSIRSDEWYVRTPWVLRQVELGFPTEVAGGMGVHDVGVLADLPATSWEVLVRPHSAPYHLFGVERGFAMEWWLIAAVQLVGVYLLLAALTRRPLVASLGAVLVTASPATQWWAPGAYLAVGYGCLTAGLLLLAARSPRLRSAVALGVAGGLAAAPFLTTLYVPWQVGTALVVGPVGLGALVQHALHSPDRRSALRTMAVAISIVGLIGGGLFGAFVVRHRSTFSAIAETEYPGAQAASEGGTADLRVMWSSALDSFSSAKVGVEVNGTNQSENSSGLVLLLPAALACFALASSGQIGRKRRLPLLASLAGGGVLAAWMILPLPVALGQFLLLQRVNPSRLHLPLTLASVVAFCLLAAAILEDRIELARWQRVAVVGVFAVPQAWAAGQYRIGADRIDLRVAAVLLLVVSIGVLLAMGRRPVVGLGVLAAFVLWQSSTIVPIQRGADPLLESPFRDAVDRIADSPGAAGGWITYDGDPFIKGTLTAAGVDHLTGVSPYPDRQAWEVLDPNRMSEGIWNRYAHVTFSALPTGEAPRFTLVAPDALVVSLDPCDRRLDRLGVRYFVTQGQPIGACADEIARVSHGAGEVTIFERART